MNIIAVIGSESHSTSSGWAKLVIDGRPMTWREASSVEWLTKYGDKHARWVECIFQVRDGALIEWEAGTNSGNRGADKIRQNLKLRANAEAEVWESEALGYPAREAKIKGRLIIVDDTNARRVHEHEEMKRTL